MSGASDTSGIMDVRAAGIEMQVRPGDKDTMVLLHGIGGRATSFAPLMRAWRPGHRLIAWDAPGYGGSDPVTNGSPSPTAYARRLAAALTELGAPRIHVAGQSLGALFAAAFARAFPERVITLTLICPAHGYGQPVGALTDGLRQRLSDAASEGMAAFAAARAHRLVSRPDAKPAVVASVREAMASIGEPGHRAAVHALAQGDLLQDCAALDRPVHVLAGSEDQITPLPGSLKLFDVLRARPRGPATAERLTVIGDAGHALITEDPAAVARALADGMEFGQ
jgi:pimeloyl-ACP methyl ester carboxylesterase